MHVPDHDRAARRCREAGRGDQQFGVVDEHQVVVRGLGPQQPAGGPGRRGPVPSLGPGQVAVPQPAGDRRSERVEPVRPVGRGTPYAENGAA